MLTKNEVQGTFLFLRKTSPGGAIIEVKKKIRFGNVSSSCLFFDTWDGAETPQNKQGKRFDRLHKRSKTTRR